MDIWFFIDNGQKTYEKNKEKLDSNEARKMFLRRLLAEDPRPNFSSKFASRGSLGGGLRGMLGSKVGLGWLLGDIP